MNAITMILAVLAAGALAGTKDTAAQVVKDAYAGLKGLIQRRLAGKPVAETALAEYERDPDTWKAPLAKELKNAGADTDNEIIAAAESLREMLEKAGTKVTALGDGSVAIGGNVSDSTIITGDRNKVEKD